MQQFKVSGMSCGHCVRAITQAIQALEQSEWAREAFGAEFLKVYVAVKRAEYRQFMGEVGEQDWRWYLSNA